MSLQPVRGHAALRLRRGLPLRPELPLSAGLRLLRTARPARRALRGSPADPDMEPRVPRPETSVAPSETLELLLRNQERFLAFLTRRTGSRELAADVLHDAYVRSLKRGAGPRSREAVTAWFYRVLRNALVDHYRRRGREARALERAAREPDTARGADDAELMETVCACAAELLGSLKPVYAAALQGVELRGQSVADYAAASGISANNASVRLHRARRALRASVQRCCGACATHGCSNCVCRAAGERARPDGPA